MSEKSIDEMKSTITTLKEELAVWKDRREQHTYCAYCGHETAVDDMAGTEISKHIWECGNHPLAILCERIEERCKDLDAHAQENLQQDHVEHASGIHMAIDKIREEIANTKRGYIEAARNEAA